MAISKTGANSSSNWWSCCRYNANNAWISNGNNGFFNGNNLYNGNGALAVSNCSIWIIYLDA